MTGAPEGVAGDRLVSADVLAEAVAPRGDDALSTAYAALVDETIGVWEAGPGTDDDVESDEIFLVLSGTGRVTFADGSAIELRPGVLVRLREGDRTTWHITERLRKLYIARA